MDRRHLAGAPVQTALQRRRPARAAALNTRRRCETVVRNALEGAHSRTAVVTKTSGEPPCCGLVCRRRLNHPRNHRRGLDRHALPHRAGRRNAGRAPQPLRLAALRHLPQQTHHTSHENRGRQPAVAACRLRPWVGHIRAPCERAHRATVQQWHWHWPTTTKAWSRAWARRARSRLQGLRHHDRLRGRGPRHADEGRPLPALEYTEANFAHGVPSPTGRLTGA